MTFADLDCRAGVRPLPPNFDMISLGSRLENLLRDRGLDW
jgi:hypothetical protein